MALFPANEAPQPIAPHGINKWSLSSRIFHWISVVLLIATWAMIELNEDATDFTYFDLHKAFGLSVLFWTIGRIINRNPWIIARIQCIYIRRRIHPNKFFKQNFRSAPPYQLVMHQGYF